MLLVSHSLGRGLTAKGASLPRLPEAGAQAARLLRVRLGAAAAVRTVTIGAGALTISISSPALAMTATSGGGGGRVRVVQAAEWDPPKGGPGKWEKKNEAMTDEARRYQSQITGAPSGWVYKIGEVSFDGYKDGVLLDAKDRYAQFFENGTPTQPKPFFRGAAYFEKRALAQVNAAKGGPIRWHFAEKEVADYVRTLFRDQPGLRSIEIVHTPRAF
jgi:hypothetical protein